MTTQAFLASHSRVHTPPLHIFLTPKTQWGNGGGGGVVTRPAGSFTHTSITSVYTYFAHGSPMIRNRADLRVSITRKPTPFCRSLVYIHPSLTKVKLQETHHAEGGFGGCPNCPPPSRSPSHHLSTVCTEYLTGTPACVPSYSKRTDVFNGRPG